MKVFNFGLAFILIPEKFENASFFPAWLTAQAKTAILVTGNALHCTEIRKRQLGGVLWTAKIGAC